MNHRELVKRAGAWLRNRKNCGVVMEELATQNNETPDALGFHGAGGSILVECKTSRADYLGLQQISMRPLPRDFFLWN
jgi:hypothetical protein